LKTVKIYVPTILLELLLHRREPYENFIKILEKRYDLLLELLKYARRHKVEYYVVDKIFKHSRKLQELAVFRRIFKHTIRYIHMLRRTLSFVKKSLEEIGVDFLVIKMYDGKYMHRTNDIDILVREEDVLDVVKYMLSEGMQALSHKIRLYKLKKLQYRPLEITFWRPFYLQIEIYANFSWAGLESLDTSFLWNNFRQMNIYGVPVKVPSFDCEILILSNHILFKNGYISMLDYVYMYDIIRYHGVNLDKIVEQAKKYLWHDELLYLLGMIINLGDKMQKGELLTFPHFLPYGVVLRGFLNLLKLHITRGNARIILRGLAGYSLMHTFILSIRRLNPILTM